MGRGAQASWFGALGRVTLFELRKRSVSVNLRHEQKGNAKHPGKPFRQPSPRASAPQKPSRLRQASGVAVPQPDVPPGRQCSSLSAARQANSTSPKPHSGTMKSPSPPLKRRVGRRSCFRQKQPLYPLQRLAPARIECPFGTGKFQMSSAYSLTARSDEHQPWLAVLKVLACHQLRLSRHRASTSRCASA